jgi:non-homologous end joining protein Ku
MLERSHKLALVSCPIALHAVCSSAERISFRQINRKTGNRLRQQLIDEETREVVEAHEKARGYEIGKGPVSQRHYANCAVFLRSCQWHAARHA